MRATPAEQPPRVEAIAWLALVLAVPPMLCSLTLANAMVARIRESMAPGADSLKATMYAADASVTVRTIIGVSLVAAAAAVGLGIKALRSRREQPSSRNTQVAGAAVIIGLLFLPLAVLALFFG